MVFLIIDDNNISLIVFVNNVFICHLRKTNIATEAGEGQLLKIENI